MNEPTGLSSGIHTLPEQCSVLMRKLPGIAVLWSVIAAQLPLVLREDLSVFAAMLILLAALTPSLFLLPLRTACLLFFLPGTIAFCLMVHHTGQIRGGELLSAVRNKNAAGKFEVRLLSPALSPGTENIPGIPSYIVAEVIRFQPSGVEEWQTFSKPQPIHLYGGIFQPEDKPGYGDIFRIDCRMTKPRNSPSGFQFAAYLEKHGSGWLLNAPRSVEKIHTGNSPGRILLNGRDCVIRHLFSSMSEPAAKALAAGILFGFAQDLGSDTKNDFLRTGTIHILTVSGTHTALFGGVLLLLLFFLPFRIRCAAVIVLLFLYTWTTGMREPATRAFIMISFFLGSRMFLLRTPAMNTLLMAAAFLLLKDPHDILEPGFQFSFLTVGMLLLSNKTMMDLWHNSTVRFRLIPAKTVPKYVFFLRLIKLRFFQAVWGSSIAILAGMGLTACYQSYLPLAALPANFLLLPVVFLCFVMTIPALCGLDFAGTILENLLLFLLNCNSALADLSVFHLAVPPLWSVMIFTALVPCLFLCRGKWRAVPAVLLTVCLFWWHLRTIHADREVLIITGNGSNAVHPAIVLTDPPTRSAYIINMPDHTAAYETLSFLRERGLDRCRLFTVNDHRKGAISGLDVLQGRLKIDRICVYPRQQKWLPPDVQKQQIQLKKTEKNQQDNLKNGGFCDTFCADLSGMSFRIAQSRDRSGMLRIVISSPATGTLERSYAPSLYKKYDLITLR